MFGYVLPRKDKLTEEENVRYRAAYCGLCRSLKRHYGFRARFLVNYDMTFLYFLLSEGEPRQPERCSCPARPFCKKDCLPDDDPMTFAADLSVLLSYWKLRDAARDGGFFRSLAAKACLALYRKPYRRACGKQPEADRVFGEQLTKLNALEDENCPSIDRAADAFASLLRACALSFPEGPTRRTAELLLYHVGRFLYLTDALEDLPRDNASGAYNPLRYRYSLENGSLSGEDKKEFLETVDASISMAASALELLPVTADSGILRNIIYYGLPTVLHSVAAGTFRKPKRGKHQ